jgi:hypothetical protein
LKHQEGERERPDRSMPQIGTLACSIKCSKGCSVPVITRNIIYIYIYIYIYVCMYVYMDMDIYGYGYIYAVVCLCGMRECVYFFFLVKMGIV